MIRESSEEGSRKKEWNGLRSPEGLLGMLANSLSKNKPSPDSLSLLDSYSYGAFLAWTEINPLEENNFFLKTDWLSSTKGLYQRNEKSFFHQSFRPGILFLSISFQEEEERRSSSIQQGRLAKSYIPFFNPPPLPLSLLVPDPVGSTFLQTPTLSNEKRRTRTADYR